MKYTVVSIAFFMLATSAQATEWYSCAIQKCSIKAENCWIKLGGAVCDKRQMDCDESDGEPIRVIRKKGELIEVESVRRHGWANGRMLQMSGSFCVDD